MTALIVISSVLAVLAVLLVFAIRYTLKRAFYSRRVGREDYYRGLEPGGRCADPERCRALIDKALLLDVERVYIKSHDGLTLTGYYHEVSKGAPIEIFFHGFRGCWQRDFCGITEAVLELGHNILFVDQRAHGESEGKIISYGINERRDAVAWINYVIRRFGKDTEIVLVGASMGGSTVLSCAAEQLPDNVKAIISDSAFSAPIDIILKVAGGGHARVAFVTAAAHLTARVIGGFNLSEMTAERAVAEAKIPIMLIHGDGDKLVPHSMAEKLLSANPKIRLETFEGADHIQSYLVDSERYKRIYKDFLNTCGVKV